MINTNWLNTIDVGFCYWLAGLVDGEGCFEIRKQHSKATTFGTSLVIKLRVDDAVAELTKAPVARDVKKLKYLWAKIRLVREFSPRQIEEYQARGIQLELPLPNND